MEKQIHQGRNIKRFREMLGISQQGLAYELGDDWSQKRISLLEARESVEDGLLDEVARVLKVPVEAIRNFDEETAIYNIQNNYDHATQNVNYQFNPVDKIVELYEALIACEREKAALLQKMLERDR
jgi:transcriptional regulator with XRE-family HTH domain